RIFETAAIRDPRSIPTLLRVCHRAHTWVEPLLYATLIIFDWNTPLSAQFLNATVRHALTTSTRHGTGHGGRTVISMLPDCYSYFIAPRGHPSDWGVATLQRPFFLSVTHLSLATEGLFLSAPIPMAPLEFTCLSARTHPPLDTAIAFAGSITVRDPRIVVMLMYADYMKDWTTGTQGGADYWREKGETERKTYPLFSLEDIEAAI
ncbi:hypothetical protein C8R47DRAFT_1172613, partial [Mycena vitilis]